MDSIRSTNIEYEEEQLELEKEHKKLFLDHHFKTGDQVTMINSNHQRFSKTGILYRIFGGDDSTNTNNKFIKLYNGYTNGFPKTLIIREIEYEDQFGMVIQRLYFKDITDIDIDFRRSFFYDYCREEKIRKMLKKI